VVPPEETGEDEGNSRGDRLRGDLSEGLSFADSFGRSLDFTTDVVFVSVHGSMIKRQGRRMVV
jgi:hypothetical protein